MGSGVVWSVRWGSWCVVCADEMKRSGGNATKGRGKGDEGKGRG